MTQERILPLKDSICGNVSESRAGDNRNNVPLDPPD